MQLNNMFKVVNLIALLGWLSLAVFYNNPVSTGIVFSGIVLLLSVMYVYLIVTGLSAFREGGFSSLPAVMALFTKPRAVLAGWVHYLAFDLMVGLFITHNSAAQGINRFVILPCLLLTFMFGPAGLLLYYIMLCVHTGTFFPIIF